MGTRKANVAPKKVDELMAFFRALHGEPTGAHLLDDEFISYVMGRLTTEHLERLDTHLASCLECAIEMERLAEASEDWQGEIGEARLAVLRERARGVLKVVRANQWFLVLDVITLAAGHLSRTRRSGSHFKSEQLFRYWASEHGVGCVLREDELGFVFTVDTTDGARNGALVRFALTNSETNEEAAAGLLVLHPDPSNEGHYVASSRLADDVVLPGDCQPRLAFVELHRAQLPDLDPLLSGAEAAYREIDRQAWCDWARREEAGWRLPAEMAEAICDKSASGGPV